MYYSTKQTTGSLYHYMKIQPEIQPTANDTLETSEVLTMREYFRRLELSELSWERFEALIPGELYWADLVYDVVEDTETKRIKALLREMRVRMLKPIGSVKRLKRILFSHISLLFGMCSSQSSLILNAFYGSSLSRIPTL